MSDRKENIKSLFTNSKTRIIIFLTLIILLVGIVFGMFRMHKGVNLSDSVDIQRNAKAIRSIPGSKDPTSQYLRLQKAENISKAKYALKEGSSAIPTILSSQSFGEGIEQVGARDGQGSLGFHTLAKAQQHSPKGLWTQFLRRSSCSIDVIKKVMSEGATLSDIKFACSCTQLRTAGFKLDELTNYCSCPDLKAAGFNAMQLKDKGYSATVLKECGFNACELKAAGYTASELKDAGFSDGELKGAGFTTDEILDSNVLPEGISERDVRKAGCSVQALRKLRAQGVSAAVIRRVSGCEIDQLKAAGFNAEELNKAGFSAAELLNAGFSPSALQRAGYSATELRNAGLSADDLGAAGYSLSEISTANATLPPGITPEQLKEAGCSRTSLERLRKAGVSVSAIKKYSNCDNTQLVEAGFSPQELVAAGFGAPSLSSSYSGDLPDGVSEAYIRRMGCSPSAIAELRRKGVTAQAIRQISKCPAHALKLAGYSASDLRNAGLSDKVLARAGFLPTEIEAASYKLPVGMSLDELRAAGCSAEALSRLRKRGVSAKAISQISGCNANALHAAGFSVEELKQAGFNDQQLRTAGFSDNDIDRAKLSLPPGVSLNDIRKAGCSSEALAKLREQGVTAELIKTLSGCNASQLKAAGYNASLLKDAGFSDAELAKAGFGAKEIQQASLGIPEGISMAEVKSAGCSPEAIRKLKAQGVSAKAILTLSGCSAKALKAAGFSADELKKAGVSDKDLIDAGYSAVELKQAGLSDDALEAAGFSKADIAAANAAMQLPAGITQAEIKAAGCSPEALTKFRNQGVSAAVIKRISGCSVSQMKAAGYSALNLKDAGFSTDDLKNAGFSAIELMQAGLNNADLKAAGFNADEIAQAQMSLPAGLTLNDVRQAGCSPKALKKLREQGVSATLIKKISGCDATKLKAAGYDASALKDAGYSSEQLKDAGFSIDEIQKANLGLPLGVSLQEVKNAACNPLLLKQLQAKGVSAEAIRKVSGCNANILKQAGFSAEELKKAGFDGQQLIDAGFNADDLKKAGFTDQQLKEAGFSDRAIQLANIESDLPIGVSTASIKKAGCSVEELKRLKAKGVSALAIKKLNKCSASDLKAAGYSAAQLSDAGFTYADLSNAGFMPETIRAGLLGVALPEAMSIEQIKKAGCTPKVLNALRQRGLSAKAIISISGCSVKDLKAAGYNALDLKQAGLSDAALASAGFSGDDINQAGLTLPQGRSESDVENAGCSPAALRKLKAQGVTAAIIRKLSGCSAQQLKDAGFSAVELKDAGLSAQQIADAGYSEDAKRAASLGLPLGVSVKDISESGCDVEALKKLKKQGVSAKAILKISGCSVKALKEAGFNAAQLLDAGFSEPALQQAGFSRQQIKDAVLGLPTGITEDMLKKTACDTDKLKELKAQGVSVDVILKLTSCNIRKLKEAGFGASELLKAGLSPSELANAGFASDVIDSAKVLSTAAVSDLRTMGCSVEAINAAKAAGLSVAEIRKIAGCSASKLKAAGFSLKDLKDAGFTAAELKNLGASADELKKAGFSANELANAGFSAENLKEAGFSAQELKDADFSNQELAKAGFNAKALKKAGADVSDLKEAGFSEQAIVKDAGFTNQEIKDSGIDFKSLSSQLPGLGDVASNQTTTEKKVAQQKPVSKKIKKARDLLGDLDLATSPNASKLSIIKENNKKLEELLTKQQDRLSSQRYQQKIQKAAAAMSGAAAKAIARWSQVPSQAFTYMGPPKEEDAAKEAAANQADALGLDEEKVLVKAGDIMFAVLDTSVNSNEPGPVMARIVTGRFKGGKLIGSFSLPSNAEKVVLSFNRLSLSYAKKTISINAVAIDPATARTAMASRVNNHYLLRYGSLFASSFLTGVGAAIQTQGNSITVNGTSVSVSEGLGRSTLQSAILGLAEVGRRWGTQAQQLFNMPPTVELFAGTGMGIMFTQDIKTIE